MLPLRSLQALICSLGMLNHRLEDGFRLCSKQQSARPALTRHAPLQLPGLASYLSSAMKGEFSPPVSFSSRMKWPDPGKGRFSPSPHGGAQGQPPAPGPQKHPVPKSPYAGARTHRCTRQHLSSPTCVCSPGSCPSRESSMARTRVFSNNQPLQSSPQKSGGFPGIGYFSDSSGRSAGPACPGCAFSKKDWTR